MFSLLGMVVFSGFLVASYLYKQPPQSAGGKQKASAVQKQSGKTTASGAQNMLAPVVAEPVHETFAQEETDVDHYLKVSGVGLGLAVAGHLLFPPLGLLSLPIIGYATLMVFEDAHNHLKKKKLHISVLDSTAICVGVATGSYVLSGVANMIYLGSLKMLYKTRNKAHNKLADIFSGYKPVVWLLKDGAEISIPLEKVSKGDLIVVNAGEMIPIDGVIVDGVAGIDQHILTGEAQPEEKTIGQKVFAATMVISGRITICVEKTGPDTVASNITVILDKTDDFVSHLQTQSERLANASVAPTIGIAGASLLAAGPMSAWIVLSSNFSEVMRLTVPMTMLNYLHIAASNGLLIKDGRSIEQFNNVDTVVFDKTGTLTLDQPHVGAIYPNNGFTESEVLYYTASAEYRQTHPIAKAILTAALKRRVELPNIDDACYKVGYGISVNLNGKLIRVGSRRFIREENISIPASFERVEQTANAKGYSLIYSAMNESLCGVIELRPTLRREAKQVVRNLKKRGMKVYILSGDRVGPVKNLADELGVDDYFADTRPEDKSGVIEELQQSGRTVCFVGDGINDSIALKKAAVSVSLQDASHIAIDCAQVVLMNKNLTQLLYAFDLAERFNTNQKTGIAAGTVIPSVICMGGAMFFGFTVTAALTIYIASVAIGVTSSIFPLLTEDESKEQSKAHKHERCLS
jgi:heavy metal translocating P-type ATPase